MLPEYDYRRITEAFDGLEPPSERIQELLEKALELKGLSYLEAGELLNVRDFSAREEIKKAAGKVKELIYGKRVVLFAPLYLSNECTNNCLYCGFRSDNTSLPRRTLSTAEAVEEACRIEGMGHKRILLVCGENPAQNGTGYVVDTISRIYENTDTRRINVNLAPQTTDDFRKLKDVGLGTYQLFQETYHLEKYRYYHPSGSKSNYEWRFTAFDRAIEAGIDDYGMGVLFGLSDYRFEVMALICHAAMLEKKWGVGPHTVSVPRLKKTEGSTLYNTGFLVNDRDITLVTAVLRLALPYTGIILSTREQAGLRNDLLKVGVSQISAGSSTAPGGYGAKKQQGTQFCLEDNRSLDEVVKDICRDGFLPSFCTACYRQERTGENFMALAKVGDIKNLCQPNAMLTFKEFLLDYASEDTRQLGEKVLDTFLAADEVARLKKNLVEKLTEIVNGKRDLYF